MNLASFRPLGGNALRFQANAPLEFEEQGSGDVANKYWEGRVASTQNITDGILSALNSISAAYTKSRQKKDDEAASQLEFERKKELQKIISGKT
jgi:hypothetical protein